MNRDGILKAAFFACKAVGLDPSVRNLVKASAAIRGLTGVARPIWGEDVRTWRAANVDENDTLAIQQRHGSDTAAPRKTAENDTPAIRVRHPRARVVKVLELQTSLIADADAPAVEKAPPALPDGLPRDFPQAVNDLKRLTVPFLAAFANVRTDEAIKKHGPAYADVLATFRSRGVSVSQAWSCFCDALAAHSGKPLFSNLANTALRYLPARPTGPQRNDGGTPVQTIPKADRQ